MVINGEHSSVTLLPSLTSVRFDNTESISSAGISVKEQTYCN